MIKTKTISVRVNLFLGQIFGDEVDKLDLPESSTVLDLLNALEKEYGRGFSRYIYSEKNKIKQNLSLLVNGENIQYLKGLNTVLHDRDLIVILPAAAGG